MNAIRQTNEKEITNMICSVCAKSPCDPRCPYAERGDAVYHCQLCDESIRSGEYFVEINRDFFHQRCIEGLDVGDWLSLIDSTAEVAETA